MSGNILELQNVKKSFGGIRALKGVSLNVRRGEVHGLIGENGAGKSTLIKILTGVHRMDEGNLVLDGTEMELPTPIAARRNGIVAIYQELSLVDEATIAENLFLGHEPLAVPWLGWVSHKELNRRSKEKLLSFGLEVSPSTKVGSLSVGAKRIIEILKALSVDARILLLDEPTTGMSQAEIDVFFELLARLKRDNVTMIYISHHLDEVFAVCDRVTVLRDGENAGTFDIADVDHDSLVKTMVGKDIQQGANKPKKASTAPVVLEVQDYFAEGMRHPISFNLHKGEILGMTGIIGAGKSELGMSLFGVSPWISGRLVLNGEETVISSPLIARKNGIAYVPEDRKTQGVFLDSTLRENLIIVNLLQAMVGPFISSRKSDDMAKGAVADLQITPPKLSMLVGNLSGGNQQKVVLGKWLLSNPQILILDEPTRGIDVGAKDEIYRLISQLAKQGVSIIILSSEFVEVAAVCDRLLILREGKIVQQINDGLPDVEAILSAALGG